MAGSQHLSTRPLIGHLLALLCGTLVTLSLAPFNLWPLGIASTAGLAWLLRDLTPRAAALRGWWFGAGLFGSGASWVYVSIHTYGHAHPILAGALTAIFCLGLALLCAAFASSYARWARALPAGNWLGFAALWTLFEWLRSWLLTGFPWLYLGYAHVESPLSAWAPVGGVFALSFITALSGASLAAVMQQKISQQTLLKAPLLITLLIWLSAPLLAQFEWSHPKGEPVRVALVQANIDQNQKWQRAFYFATLDRYQQMSEPLWAEHDLVVWPEAAIPSFYRHAQPYFNEMAKRASANGATLISGVPTRSEQGLAHNSIIALDKSASVYHKQKLVPFGEYVPLESWLRGTIQFFNLPMSAFYPGTAQQSPLIAGNQQLAPFICYEIAYPELIGQWLPESDLLITISNDAWFGDSLGPKQHLQMAQMRALESGRDLIRSTGSGITALVNYRGEVTQTIPAFEQGVLSGSVQPRQGVTPFVALGSHPILWFCAACLLIPLIRHSRKAAH